MYVDFLNFPGVLGSNVLRIPTLLVLKFFLSVGFFELIASDFLFGKVV